jgi:hypothetical protein
MPLIKQQALFWSSQYEQNILSDSIRGGAIDHHGYGGGAGTA